MRVLSAGIALHFLQHRIADGPWAACPGHFFEHARKTPLQLGKVRFRRYRRGIRCGGGTFVWAFRAGDADLFHVPNDDIVTRIDMGCISGLCLPRRRRATSAANRPRTLSAASTTNQSRRPHAAARFNDRSSRSSNLTGLGVTASEQKADDRYEKKRTAVNGVDSTGDHERENATGHKTSTATDHDSSHELERWKRSRTAIASHQQKPSPPFVDVCWRDPSATGYDAGKTAKLLRLPVERRDRGFFLTSGRPER